MKEQGEVEPWTQQQTWRNISSLCMEDSGHVHEVLGMDYILDVNTNDINLWEVMGGKTNG